ncbi:MAG TPA: D-alanyl-D-alanine carboxypeptidase/D-alanyl-D-alanine-endopeptidase [Noviherbaspirillum sp.]|nr:D-alanyl-D-alanine carboxypeptidase/D-alanyl-D-alanine-endopeptidase [Noviherbaspirillum sp.]
MERAGIPASAVGIHVAAIEQDTVLLSLNEKTPYNPASVMKLLTTNAALETLGPAFRWTTTAYATGGLADGVLHGDLIIQGSGDPKLVLENFWLFLRRIRAAGVREIRGDLILERGVFAAYPHDPAAFDGDPLRPYNVGPDALLLNFKSLALRFIPDGTATRVLLEPPLAGFPVQAPHLLEGECGDWRARLSAQIDAGGARFPGTYSASCGEQTWYVHPHPMSHTQYFDALFRRIWTDLGGELRGQVREGPLPADARRIAQWESAPLSELIRDINKFSNNVMARQLLLTMANRMTTLPANPVHGAAVVRTWLGNKGIDAADLVIDNGSGLSREERVSALMLARMLVATWRSPLMPEFVASLPLVGQDGTMRRRLTADPIAGRAHVKTGRLDEVRAIAGYVMAASGRRYAVVCLINHRDVERAHEVQDALLQWVYESG